MYLVVYNCLLFLKRFDVKNKTYRVISQEIYLSQSLFFEEINTDLKLIKS